MSINIVWSYSPFVAIGLQHNFFITQMTRQILFRYSNLK